MKEKNGNNRDPSNNNPTIDLYIKINKIINKLKQYHTTNFIISPPLFDITSDKSIFSNLKIFSFENNYPPLINFLPQIEDSLEIKQLWTIEDSLEDTLEDSLEIEEIIINTKINKLFDLIELCNEYPLKKKCKI